CILLEELRNNCETIRQSLPEIIEWAKESDFKDLQANGYWTYVKIVEKFIDLVEDSIRNENSKPFDHKLVKVSRVLLVYLDTVCKTREAAEIDFNFNTKKLFAPFPEYLTKYFNDYFAEDHWSDVQTIYGHFSCFWLCRSLSFLLNIFTLLTAIVSKFPESLCALWDRDYRGKTLLETMRNANTDFPFSMWAITEWRIHTKLLVPLFNIGSGLRTSTVFIPRQKTWIIPEWSKGRVQRKYFAEYQSRGKGVRCRLLQHRTKSQNDTLVLHMHGGGFITQSPDSHEMYLRHWASNISGVPILSVDYTLNVKYPIALQEVLDVYLWCVSGNPNVKKLLGFNPTKIVLCGDSAGGLLGITLCAVLHDIRKIYERNHENVNLLFPSSFVGIYTTFNFHHLTPSLLLSLIEPVVATGPLLACAGLYTLGVRYDEDFAELEKEFENKEIPDSSISGLWLSKSRAFHKLMEVARKISRSVFGQKSAWYRCDIEKFEQRLAHIFRIAQHPYINAMNTDLIESLENMSVFLITSHYDVLLDNNVEFAKTWKGEITLDVVDGLSHGFLHWCFLSREAQKASDICLKRLQQAIGFY
ncbi:hormone-sensitive lipase-like isoform X2, partial [Dinothrombium tinctorium]